MTEQRYSTTPDSVPPAVLTEGYVPADVPTTGPAYDWAADPGYVPPAAPSRAPHGMTAREWRTGDTAPQRAVQLDDERHEVDLDRAYQWERFGLRMVGYALYLAGVIGYAIWAHDWTSWLALAAGGLVPVAYLLGTESHERMIEADRKANMPETRGRDLPHLRRGDQVTAYDDDDDPR